MFDFLAQKFSDAFASITGKSHISGNNIAGTLKTIEQALLEADAPYAVVQDFVKNISSQVMGQKVIRSVKPGDQFTKIVYDQMVQFLGGPYTQETFTFQIPSTILLMGLQGSGKTTTAGKLAFFIKKQAEKRGKSRKILCASVDFYRPAAIEQLKIVSESVGVDFYQAQATEVVFATQEIITFAKKQNYEHLILDTAGRLQVDDAMMQELKQIKKMVDPKYSFLVLDSMTGQESLAIAQSYDQSVGFDSAILSKMDGSSRAGAAFAFRYVVKKPIYFVGTGEKSEQLDLFRPERAAQRMLGMGDLKTLVENVQEKIKISDQKQIEQSLISGNITLDDFAKQLQMVSKLGSLSSMLQFIPGMGSIKISQTDMSRGEQELKKFKVILSSMTYKERVYPSTLSDLSRKKRIADGAGVSLVDVNLLLQRFEQSKQFVKLLKKNRFFDK